MAFDIRTAYLLLGVMCVTVSLGVYAALRVQVRRGHRLWVAGGLAFGAACTLLAYRLRIPDLLTFQGMFVCLIGGLMLHAASLWEEWRRRVPMAWLAGVLAVLLLLYEVLRHAAPAYGVAFTIACLGAGGAGIIGVALALWWRRRQAGAAVIAVAFAFLLVGLLARAWFLSGIWTRGGPLDPGVPQVVLIISAFLTMILANVGYLGLQFDHVAAQRAASQAEAARQAERAQQTAQREAQLQGLLEERDQLIQRLARSQAAEDLAQFATDLPHELSQPLCASQLNLETLGAHLEARGDDALALRAVRAVEGNNERVLRLLQQLRILLQTHQDSDRETLDLCLLVERTVPVMQSSFRDAGAALVASLPREPVFLEASRTQLQQVILILCTHVLEAIRVGGLANAACTVHVAYEARADELCLLVDGPRSARLEPARQGVGLSIARRIAAAHQGRLEIGDAGGFRLWLPARPAA